MSTAVPHTPEHPTLLGHPTGLFTLFFAEMWERFSYYGMRALLIFYMIKGFLGYNDGEAYGVYGAYTALVYATPFIGGMLADRLIGARRAVVLGGLLMAAGHLVMTVEKESTFFVALALLIVGNGFFKPNISTIVGGLYKDASKRDGGFTIFYMGINLGAAMSPLLCGYIGETYGWHYGFGLATIGMLIGLAVFVAPAGLTRALILIGALAAATTLVLTPDGIYMVIINGAVAAALVAAAVLAFIALGRGGLPKEAGAVKNPERLKLPAFAGLKANVMPFYLGIIAAVMMLQHVVPEGSHEGWIIVAIGMALLTLPWVSANHAIYICTAAAVPVIALLVQRGEVAGMLLILFGLVALGSLFFEALRASTVERHRIFVVLILMFFSMLFWAFFEQAGSSVSNFTDRNVDRVAEDYRVDDSHLGKRLELELTQEQLGFAVGGQTSFRLNHLQAARDAERAQLEKLTAEAKEKKQEIQKSELQLQAAKGTSTVDVMLDKAHMGMGVAVAGAEVPASVFQAANPIFIMIFGLLFTALWAFLAKRRIEPSIPVKFALGLIQLGLGFIAFWYGAEQADDRGMVWMGWLLLGYLLHTTGELCISPVGLSMVVKLSPKRIVATVMGAWFLATAFSNYLAAIIATLTGVEEEAETKGDIPIPAETLDLYSDVFLKVGIAAGVAAILLLVLSPLLNRWMHHGEEGDEGAPPPAGH